MKILHFSRKFVQLKTLDPFWLNVIGGVGLWLLIIQTVFTVIQFQTAKTLQTHLATIINSEVNTSNFGTVSRGLVDLETLGAIRCVRLGVRHRHSSNFGFVEVFESVQNNPSQCHSNRFPMVLNGVNLSSDLESQSGTQFRIHFQSVNSGGFEIALWLARFGGVAILLLGGTLARNQIRNRDTILLMNIKKSEEILSIIRQVAHDIRSPLSAISAVASSMPADSQSEKRKKILVNASARVNGIAEDLLRKYNAPHSVSHIGESINQIVEEAKARLPLESKTVIQIATSPEVGETYAKIDSSSLNRVLSNLLNNSIDAMSESGGNISLSASRSSECVTISIEDEGPGIPSKILEFLNKGISVSTKPIKLSVNSNGNGIGTSTAHSTVSKYGGKIFYSNRPDRPGAKVNIQLLCT